MLKPKVSKLASCLGGVFLSIWTYFKDSWEGPDGKFSYRRFSQYIFLVILIKLSLWDGKTKFDFYTLCLFAFLYLVMALMMSVEQIIKLVKCAVPLISGKQENEPDSTTQNQNEQE